MMVFRIMIKTIFVLVILGSLIVNSVFANEPDYWGDLKAGNYAVGFKTIEYFDESRTVLPKYDYLGNKLEGKRSRPIQLCIWYPAVDDKNIDPMVLGEYMFPYPENTEFMDYLSEIQTREMGLYFGMFGMENGEGALLDAQNLQVTAKRGLMRAEGEFPLIINGLHTVFSIDENFILFEYLASNGYVIVTTHSIGTESLTPQINTADIETAVRDLDFVFGKTRQMPEVDKELTVAMGFGKGAAAAILLQMRNSDIDASVCFDGSYMGSDFQEAVTSNPFYNPDKLDKSLLNIYRAELTGLSMDIIDSLLFAKRTSIQIADSNRYFLSSYGVLLNTLIVEPGENTRNNRKKYESLCEYILNYLNYYIKADESAKAAVENPQGKFYFTEFAEFMNPDHRQLPPNPSQFMAIIEHNGVDLARELYDKFKDERPRGYFFTENDFNLLGYGYFQRGQTAEALSIFEMNADAYPRSANVWDSMGELCEYIGRNDDALKYLKKALVVLEADSTSPPNLRNAIKTHAEGVIARLEGQNGEE